MRRRHKSQQSSRPDPFATLRQMWKPRCSRCGNAVRTSRMLKQWLRREEMTYPFPMIDGTRREVPVRWLCGACESRAQAHRRKEGEGEAAQRQKLRDLDAGDLGEGYFLVSVLAEGDQAASSIERMERRLRTLARSVGEGDVHWVREAGSVRFYTHSRALRDAWVKRQERA